MGEEKIKHNKRKFGKSKFGILDRLIEGFKDLLCFMFVDIKTLMKREKSYEIKEVIKNDNK